MAEYLPMTMGDIVDFAAENIPEDYEIRSEIRRGEMEVILINPEGRLIDLFPNGFDDMAEAVRRCVNHARNLDGLGSVDFKGNSIPPGTEDDYV